MHYGGKEWMNDALTYFERLNWPIRQNKELYLILLSPQLKINIKPKLTNEYCYLYVQNYQLKETEL
jgi:hypothetical protein